MLSLRAVPLNTDGHYNTTKTPARGLKNRAENAVHAPPLTVQGKGRTAALRTPFHPKTAHSVRVVKDVSGPQTLFKNITRVIQPLGDKTPAPNCVGNQFQTPVAQKKPIFLLNEQVDTSQAGNTPSSVLRPSSTRKHVRAPRSASKSFETPVNSGNPWDVSDTSIVIPEACAPDSVVEDDYDQEIEYMAPNTLDLPYQPPFDFDIPDYKVVGSVLRQLSQSYPCDDYSPPEPEIKVEDIVPDWNLIPLPDIESDSPFALAKVRPKPVKPSLRPNLDPKPVLLPKISRVPQTVSSASTSVVRPTSRTVSRPATSLSTVTRTTGAKPGTKPLPMRGQTTGIIRRTTTESMGSHAKQPVNTTTVPSKVPTRTSRPPTATSMRPTTSTSLRRPGTSTSLRKTINDNTSKGSVQRLKKPITVEDPIFFARCPQLLPEEEFLFDV